MFRVRMSLLAYVVLACAWHPEVAMARPATPAPPLPMPAGATIVNVSTEAQLQAAIGQLRSNTTVVVAPGTYHLSRTLAFNGTLSDVGIRGATGDRDDVVIQGPGMSQPGGAASFGIWTGGNVQRITIANLTLRGFSQHPIIFNAGTQRPHVYNVHLIDAGEQFIKSNPGGPEGGVHNGIVEYSVIEYTTVARSDYTNGVDVHTGDNWIIRHNLFRNIQAPPGQLAGPAVLMWNHSTNTLTEGNTFDNCARGISYGLVLRSGGNDHVGGIIRNNVFFRSRAQAGDVGILVADSPNTHVLNNTVFASGTYPSPIEFRFVGSTGVILANNLLDGAIAARDGATGSDVTNRIGATADLFLDAGAGNLHLAPGATSVIDRGTTLSDVRDDADGEMRPAGAGYDIGADEFGAAKAAYTIGGWVRDAETGEGVAGVVVTLRGARVDRVETSSLGGYLFFELAGNVDYVVAPVFADADVAPVDRFFPSLAADVSAEDFVIRRRNASAVARTSTNCRTLLPCR